MSKIELYGISNREQGWRISAQNLSGWPLSGRPTQTTNDRNWVVS